MDKVRLKKGFGATAPKIPHRHSCAVAGEVLNANPKSQKPPNLRIMKRFGGYVGGKIFPHIKSFITLCFAFADLIKRYL